MANRLTTADFIEKAQHPEVHGLKYDYSLTEYVKSKEKVKIICRKHGTFLQKPNYHLRRHGCPSCGLLKRVETRTSNTKEFIDKAQAEHGPEYDYSETEYIKSDEKVKIICKTHGPFLQEPNSHLNGSGCHECSNENKRLTTADFIEKAQHPEVHGLKYDYSETEYINTRTKVKIICKTHGPFLQPPNSHLKCSGCPSCANDKKAKFLKEKAKKDFIPNAQVKHGDTYDYSAVEYIDSLTKVNIICKIHGSFFQTPKAHLNGCKCPECSNEKQRKTQTSKDFIPNSIAKHGLTYDYSEVEYVHSKTKVKIICKIHGPFLQIPNDHLNGSGCPECSNKKQRKTQTSKDFIPNAIVKHGLKYDYSEVEYIHSHEKVKIICKEHGPFLQTPNAHLQDKGCFKCGNENRAITSNEKAKKDFIPESIVEHGDTYDYSEVEYINNKTKVNIICKEHGPFLQTPASHLSGCGCPNCGKIKVAHNWLHLYEENKELGSEPGIFYLLKFKHNSGLEFIKVGITN